MEYQHGGDIYSHKIRLDYSANINPFGLPEAVRQAAADSLSYSACYPDSACRELTAALSRRHLVPAEQIVCGNGAADLIFGLALAKKPRKALVTAPAFGEYEQALKTVDAQVCCLMLAEEQGFCLETEAFSRALTEGVEMAFLCNPNNPTGVPVLNGQIEEMAGLCRDRGILLVVDECFCDFLENGSRCSGISLLEKFENLVILKAFTKLYAMAGLRLGYCLCGSQKTAEQLKMVRQPWSVSNVAQAAGLAALSEEAYVAHSLSAIARQRRWLKEQLEELGFRVYDSQANYIFFRVPEKMAAKKTAGSRGWLYEALLKREILIRSCGNYRGLDSSYYRICVGLEEHNRELMETMREILAK